MINFKADLALQAIEDERVTASMGIPTMFQNMLSEMRSRTWNVDSLRHVQYGGSPTAQSVTLELMEALGCSLLQCYGRTEELAITFLSPEDHVQAAAGVNAHRLQSCGREAWLTKVRLIDANQRCHSPRQRGCRRDHRQVSREHGGVPWPAGPDVRGNLG